MNEYDVIIIGGGTAGCSAAYNCAVSGLKTLLIEKNAYLGGAMTGGLVVPVMQTGNNTINTDFYNKLVFEMRKASAQVTFQGNCGWFNPEILKIVLDKMLTDAGVDIKFFCEVESVILDNNIIKAIKLSNTLSVYNYAVHTNNAKDNKTLSEYTYARYFVDSTGDLNFCKKIKCNFLENNYEIPPTSLRFIMSGIDIKQFSHWLIEQDADREATPIEVIDGEMYVSTAYTWDNDKNWALQKYFDAAVARGTLKDTDRNYFQIFSVAGASDSMAFNCPRLLEKVDIFDNTDVTKLLLEARQAIYRISEFCKNTFPGFKKAYISNISDYLGIRASNRIKGKYIYTINDLRAGKRFASPVLVSEYPIDLHSAVKDSSKLEKIGRYELPIESLMSADYDNLYVAGRGISADELSQSALRVQANCFSMGEAVAKHIKSNINNFD